MYMYAKLPLLRESILLNRSLRDHHRLLCELPGRAWATPQQATDIKRI